MNITILLLSIFLGFLFIYVFQSKPKIIIKYPTPENINDVTYVDDNGLHYKYKIEEIKSPN